MTTKQVWFCLKTLDDILKHTTCSALFDHYSVLDPFLRIPKSSMIIFQTILFHVQLTCDYSNSQLTIATTLTCLVILDVNVCLACCRLPASRIIFHLFTRVSSWCNG